MGRRPDLTPLPEARRELAGRYFPFALRLAQGYCLHWPTAAPEFRSAAALALCLAARDYDPAQGAQFATYARLRIAGALPRDVLKEMALRGFRGTPGDAPKIVTLTPAEWSVALAHAVHGRRQGDFEDLIAGLPVREAATLRMIYFDGLTPAEAARVVGRSSTLISSLAAKGLAHLRERFKEPPDDA